MPTEGKSTTAINIALVSPKAGTTWVWSMAISARHGCPSTSTSSARSVSAGCSVAGVPRLGAAADPFHGLTALTSGAVPPNPSELLGSDAPGSFSRSAGAFDYVIVDSTPLLAVTDAAILAAGADGVLIMARFGQTKREQLAHAAGKSPGCRCANTSARYSP